MKSHPSFIATFIPDQSTVVAQISLVSQRLAIYFDELSVYFWWIERQAGQAKGVDLVNLAAGMTIRNVIAGEERWDEILAAGNDWHYSLGSCLNAHANSCFQRAIFFHLMMQKVEILAKVVQGEWIESTRKDLRDIPEETLSMSKEGNRIDIEDDWDSSLWNILEIDGQRYLVDVWNLIHGKPVFEAISDDQEVKQHITQLPNGNYRHYMGRGTVEVINTK